jgi:hypothetical protein
MTFRNFFRSFSANFFRSFSAIFPQFFSAKIFRRTLFANFFREILPQNISAILLRILTKNQFSAVEKKVNAIVRLTIGTKTTRTYLICPN